MSNYKWEITQDLIDGDAVGTIGPHDAPDNLTTNPVEFKMYDGDGNLYYVGMLYGEYDELEPLDDFGMPNAGCTEIKVNGVTV